MIHHTSKKLESFAKFEDRLALKSRLYSTLRDKYQSPPSYVEWNSVLRSFAPFGEAEYIKIIREASRQDLAGPICAGMGAAVAAELDAPAIYLTQQLTEALAQTNATVEHPPELVLPCFFLCLPKGVVRTPDGVSVTSVLVYITEAVKSVIPDYMDFTKLSRILHTVEERKGRIYIAATTERREVLASITGWNYEDADTYGEMSNAITQLERIVKNVILIYNYQKQLITAVPPTPARGGFGKYQKGKTRSPLPTTILGKNFLVRQPSASAQHKNQTISTKRPHWRKGHWHTVLTGAGRKERRLRWFQPVYVNPTLDT